MANIRTLDNKVNIIGNTLKHIRENKGLSQTDLCCKLELLGVTMFKSDIYEIENNKRLVKLFALLCQFHLMSYMLILTSILNTNIMLVFYYFSYFKFHNI